jgi:nucleotide-binding universal stress UspA family protein
MIKKILFATDLGILSTHSLIHVESLARSYGAKISIVHAVPPLGELAAAVVRSQCSETVKAEVLRTPHIKGLLETMRAEIFAMLSAEPWAEADFMSLIGDVVVAPGQPAAVILQQAEYLHADLIVIGSHGTDALDGRMLGSVAAKVLQLAKVPVFMVPMLDLTQYSAAAWDVRKAESWQ